MIRPAVPLLAGLAFSAALAQWKPASGPAGVRLQTIAARGSEIFAAQEESTSPYAQRTAYRSRDEGRTWTAMPLDAAIGTFAFCGDVLLAGTRQGVRRLAPGDSAFRRSSSGIAESFRVVVAAQGRFAFAGGDWGVYRSADEGLTWAPSGSGLSDSISALAADSVEIVAAAFNGHVYHSRDSGATWARWADLPAYATDLGRCQGRTFASGYYAALRLSQDGSRWDTVFAYAKGYYTGHIYPLGSDLFAHNGDGLRISADAGATWTRVSQVFGERVGLTGLARLGAYTYASSSAGIFRSPDRGATWIGMNQGKGLSVGPAENALAFQGDTLFSIGAGLLRFSIDSGASWSTRDSASGKLQFTSLASGSGFLFAGTYGTGVLRSRDAGRTWDPSGPGLPDGQPIDKLFLGPKSLLAYAASNGLYRSTDLGATWKAAQTGLANTQWQSLRAMGDTLLLGTTAGIYASRDGGAGWWKTGGSGKGNYNARCLATQGRSAYAYVQDAPWDSIPGGLYFSRNLEGAWTRIPMRGLRDTVLTDIVAYGTTLFAATDSGLYRSADSGLNWTPMNEGLSGRVAFGTVFWIQGTTLYTNVDGLWMRPLSDFGPVESLGGAVSGSRVRRRPGLLPRGGGILVSVPGGPGRKPSRFDVRGKTRE